MKIGVVGAGVMGVGVTQSFAQHGYEVVLVDKYTDVLVEAKKSVRNGLRSEAFFGNKEIAKSSEKIMSKIEFSDDFRSLADVEFVVENVTEDWDIKEDVYTRLNAICTPTCKFAVNTSVIMITKVASLLSHPENVLGIHFMNPVPRKSTVEAIKGDLTSQDTIDTALNLLEGIGKKAVVVNDSPGFVSNRVLMLMINEAIFLLQENISNAEDVDRIFVECFGHAMGPLATADLIGLDTILLSLEMLYKSFNDSKYRPCTLLMKMVYAGKIGCKSKQGFFTY